MKTPSGFIIINPFGIGDILFSTPLIRNLHENFPGAPIHYFCKNHVAPLARQLPFVSSVIEYDRDAAAALKGKSFPLWGKAFYDLIVSMRRAKAGVCLDLSLNTPYGFMALAAGIPLRVGFDYRKRAFFLNKKVSIDGYAGKHVADHYLDLLPLIGIRPVRYGLAVNVDEASRRWAAQTLAVDSQRPLVALVPGGGGSWGKDAGLKQWPAEKFTALAGLLQARFNARCVIIGDSADMAAGKFGPPAIDLRAKCTLLETLAALERCVLVVANDSGPFHMAQALGKETVAFFGPVDDTVYGPYPDSTDCAVLKRSLDCRPCYNRFRLKPCQYPDNRPCLGDITVEEAFLACQQMLGNI